MHTLGYRIILSIICTYIKEHIWNEANCKDTGIKRLTEHLFWWSTVFTVTVQTLPRESRCPQSHPLRSLLDGSASSVSLLRQHGQLLSFLASAPNGSHIHHYLPLPGPGQAGGAHPHSFLPLERCQACRWVLHATGSRQNSSYRK